MSAIERFPNLVTMFFARAKAKYGDEPIGGTPGPAEPRMQPAAAPGPHVRRWPSGATGCGDGWAPYPAPTATCAELLETPYFAELLEVIARDWRKGKRSYDARANPYRQDEWRRAGAAEGTCTR